MGADSSGQLGRGNDAANMSAYELLRLYVSDKLVSFESVSRARRKVQEIHKELRGKKYKERQNHQEQVKEVLGYKV